jgi:hypothetical protein
MKYGEIVPSEEVPDNKNITYDKPTQEIQEEIDSINVGQSIKYNAKDQYCVPMLYISFRLLLMKFYLTSEKEFEIRTSGRSLYIIRIK